MNIQVALLVVDPRNLFSVIIAAVTGQPFTHSAICVDGIWYDASESRGDFNFMSSGTLEGRKHAIIEFTIDNEDKLRLQAVIDRKIGKRYDYKGVAGWVFGFRGNRDRFYCFEATYFILQLIFNQSFLDQGKKSAIDIESIIKKNGITNWSIR